jgi:secreted PhoX family phosphatase
MKRRAFVIAGAAASLGAALGLWQHSRERARQLGSRSPLVRDPDGLLDLPPGFRYRILQREGERMSDDYRVPGRPDAMATIALENGLFALMRNHELNDVPGRGAYFADTEVPDLAYDARSMGGVTRMVLDARGNLVSSNLVLTGTTNNCAAGVSPWGYLTCEESVAANHGYVFLCDVHAERVAAPRKIPAYGRFRHEAAAIDPLTCAAYLTEDRPDGCLYRFMPKHPGAPFSAGRLQAMGVRGAPGCELATSAEPGRPLEVTWVDVPAEAGERDELRQEAKARGAAVVRRGEGIWRVGDGFAFTSTTGGREGYGQIFHITPSADGGTLALLFESDDRATLDMPDNLTLAPWGDLIVCEDNQRSEHLRIVTRDGRVLPLAHNAQSAGEFAGACFSPSGALLLVNLQEEGLTLALEGPFQRYATGAV